MATADNLNRGRDAFLCRAWTDTYVLLTSTLGFIITDTMRHRPAIHLLGCATETRARAPASSALEIANQRFHLVDFSALALNDLVGYLSHAWICDARSFARQDGDGVMRNHGSHV